jgi:hypothetical protein
MSAKLDLSALKNIDFSKVLGVLRQRWIMITCGLVVLIAPLGAWFAQGLVQADIDKSIKDRVKLFDDLNGLKKGTVTIRMPDGTSKDESAAINDTIINRIREHNEALGKSSGSIYAEALRRNRSDHALLPGLDAYLPRPTKADEATRDILLQKWEQFIRPARQQVTGDPALSGPVAAAESLARAQGAEQQFFAANRIRTRAEVPAGELPKLLDAVRDARIQAALDHAAGVNFYLDSGAIHWQGKPKLEKVEGEAAVDAVLVSLYRQQWDLWLVADLLKALKATNARVPGGPMKSPVKRVIAIDFDGTGYPKAADPNAATSSDSGEAGEAIAPDKDAALDFKAGGLLGLVSNQLYDVRSTVVQAVVETSAIPALVNELARCNFISVADVKLQPADPFEALRKGYVYGPQPCSAVTLTLKSVWFRDWTTERMPVAMLKTIKSAGKPKQETGEAAKPAAAGQ